MTIDLTVFYAAWERIAPGQAVNLHSLLILGDDDLRELADAVSLNPWALLAAPTPPSKLSLATAIYVVVLTNSFFPH